jgi:hypothetical protein
MSEPHQDVLGWDSWVDARGRMLTKLSASDRSNSKNYFVDLHAAIEAMFRRILFVGLRLNEVTYLEADAWIFQNDETPNKEKYPQLFDAIYKKKGTTWDQLLASVDGLKAAWELWLGFPKIIRNHILHGVRSYEAEWIECAIRIDQELVVRLDAAISGVIGGSPIGALDKLSPRLPRGKQGLDIYKLVGRKPSKYLRQKISLHQAKLDLDRIDSERIWI